MDALDRIIEIATAIHAMDLARDLVAIRQRAMAGNSELIFPLVGEFSSGKTTLINALTDSKKLETATQPTTATIYEIHFGCEKCHAQVYDEKGNVTEIDDMDALKNEVLKDATVVNVFDTSTQVPPTTILVDTPGLSSPDPKHKQTLVDFLPKADGIFLVTDVNQQITRSLTDFIEMMKLSKRPIYLVITKSDTKSVSELENVKRYICDNCKLPIQQMACVSAVNHQLDEFHLLLERIQKDKNNIIQQVDGQRTAHIVKTLLERIDELLHASHSDKELEDALRKLELDLRAIDRNIDSLVKETQSDIEDKARQLSRQFEDTIASRLEMLVTSKSANFNADAVAAINNTSSLLLNDFRNRIQDIFREKAAQRRHKDKDETLSLSSLEGVDLSQLNLTGLNYNLDLNSLGHQYDSMIATATKVIAAAAAVAAVAASGGTAAAIGTLATADNVIDMADTVSDVSSIISNQRTANRIEKAVGYATKVSENMGDIENYNQMAGQQMGQQKGIVESMVGFVTDKAWGKPQRRRAIHDYLDKNLIPEFKTAMDRVCQQLLTLISTALHQEAAETIHQKKTALEQLKQKRAQQEEEFARRISQLRDYKNELITL